jgi:lathosterol oxidase
MTSAQIITSLLNCELLNEKLVFWLLLYPAVLFLGGYFLLAGTLHITSKSRKLHWIRYKIQKGYPSPKNICREIKFSISTAVIFVSALLITGILQVHHIGNLYFNIHAFGTFYLIVSFFLTLFVHDTYFYWTHRLMHLPGIFAVHRLHHASHNPSPFAALSFHPAEALIQAGIIPLLSIILPTHISVLILFVLYNLIVNIIGHAGYEFFPKKFNKTILGRISNTPTHHNLHHKKVKGNYGLYFSLWDKFMGTYDAETDILFERITEEPH